MNHELRKALTFVDRYGVAGNLEIKDWLPEEPETVSEETQEERIFNVMISQKPRGKRAETQLFSLLVPAGMDEHTYIRNYVHRTHPNWLLGGYAPRKENVIPEAE